MGRTGWPWLGAGLACPGCVQDWLRGRTGWLALAVGQDWLAGPGSRQDWLALAAGGGGGGGGGAGLASPGCRHVWSKSQGQIQKLRKGGPRYSYNFCMIPLISIGILIFVGGAFYEN